ncbi:MAG: hypothetical protein MOGMAGMI_00482 [Candidatus Omnitrophica bacterium]|nr:hypothetical protein [Candidatus Omnitrophota bacterium]
MPHIRPFKAWRYDARIAGRLDRVYAPPYDVISAREQAALKSRSPYNFVRVELPDGRDGAQKYAAAADILKDWRRRGVLRLEEAPSLYVYVQDYREGSRKATRVGFLAAMRLDEGAVLKHENTLAKPKKDRMALLKKVRANLSPIFGLFEDPSGAVQRQLLKTLKGVPQVDVTVDGVRHRLYVESRPQVISAVCRGLSSRPMFIADGHHRFEVASMYRRAMGSRRRDPKAGWNYAMVYFTDCRHNPFTIWPTHRLVRTPKGWTADKLAGLGRLSPQKDLRSTLARLSATRAEAGAVYDFGLYTRKDGFRFFELDGRLAPRRSEGPVELLDVAVLHRRLIEPVFGIRAIEKSEDIDFTRSAEEAVERVRSGEFGLAVFLRPTSLDEMLTVSKKGLKMPQKSTYFYPKLLSGLVVHGHDDGEAGR